MAQPFVRITGRRIDLTGENQTIFPQDNIVKKDIITYYRTIARVMLRHIQGRALTMEYFPTGIDGERSLIDTRPDDFPDWMPSGTTPAHDGTSATYVTAETPADLVYLVNAGMVVLHTGLSRLDRINYPDRIVFDLDPSTDDFSKVLHVAVRLKRHLSTLGLTSFIQTTGSRGLHLVAPIKRTLPFEDIKTFAGNIAYDIAGMYPDMACAEKSEAHRGQRVFIDFSRNALGRTMVVPYSLRAQNGAPVATPLDWKEINATDLSSTKYNVRSILRRLSQKSDPWTSINRRASGIQKAQHRHIATLQAGAA